MRKIIMCVRALPYQYGTPYSHGDYFSTQYAYSHDRVDVVSW